MTPLQKAAQAVIDRWDSPLWKDQPHTGVYIAELRKALEAEQAQAVEPIGYIRHADKTFWPHPECAVYASVSPSLAPVYAHPAPPPVATVKEPLKVHASAEDYMRHKYGAYRGHFAWRELEEAYSQGRYDELQAKGPSQAEWAAMEAQQVAVPMTEAQIFACDPVPHVMFDQQRIDFARAIEAFHGIGAKP